MWRLLLACLKPSPCRTHSALSAEWQLSSSTAGFVKLPSFLPDSSCSPQLPQGFKFSFSSSKTPHDQHLWYFCQLTVCSSLLAIISYSCCYHRITHKQFADDSLFLQTTALFLTWARTFPAPTRSQSRQEHECHHSEGKSCLFFTKYILEIILTTLLLLPLNSFFLPASAKKKRHAHTI